MPLPPPPAGGTNPSPGRPCPWYTGPGASNAAVKAALESAAGTSFWQTSAPQIKVPYPLMKAIAWQESGWQSTIIACDGGIGTMQIMPDTATWMNRRFGTAFDVNTLAGNTAIGAEYIEWLIKYFGDVYFQGSYDLTDPQLLDVVIAAYNVGPAGVETPDGRLSIPNTRYVANVKALMTNCVCLTY